MSYDYYIIHSRSLSDFAQRRCEFMESQGYKCYLPCRDVDESQLPLQVAKQIFDAIAASKKAILIWDTVSYGAMMDMWVCMFAGVGIEDVIVVGMGQPLAVVNELKEKRT